MRFLVISTPKSPAPLEELPGMLAAEREWYDRNRESLEAYGWFADKGGFGLVNVPDLETLSRINREHPFSYSSEIQIRAVVDADVAVQQVRTLLEQQGVAAPA
ncbi:MAG: hypothetical protein ACRDLZ_08005 [Gaiellaceae bacterium]